MILHRRAFLALALAALATPSLAKIRRSRRARAAFQRANPCPESR